MNLQNIIEDNIKKLSQNSYPGRGIIIGKSPNDKYLIQVYWIMGRSENSRNRIFVNENEFVKTEAFDESKLTDPSLIIYYPVKQFENIHIISNGDQTDTIFDSYKEGSSFENAIQLRNFEPDEPNFTPRISGVINLQDRNDYELSIIKSSYNNSKYTERYFYKYEKAIPGVGHFIHTYEEDGEPLPSFSGEPKVVKLMNEIDEVADFYWNLLDENNKISLLVKFIDASTGKSSIKIINKNNK